MPYTVSKGHGCPEDKPYAVVKKSDGSKLGCHATPEAAGKQIAAVERSEREKATHEWSERMRAVRSAARPDFTPGLVKLHDVELVVEVAHEDRTRKAGYRFISEPSSDGLLFVYDEDVSHPFTCREVEFDLDIFWFDADGKLIGRDTVEAHHPTPISLDRNYRFVLEVPSGTVDIGDDVVLHSQYEVWTESNTD